MATSKTNFQVWNACEKCGVYKIATLLGIPRGLSLNLGWDKCDVWLVDQWVPFSLCAFVCLSVDSTLRALIWLSLMHVWLLCSFEALTCWLYWLILLFVLTYCIFLLYDYSTHHDLYILIVAYLVHYGILIFFSAMYYLDHLWACYSFLLDTHLIYHVSSFACT